MNTLRSAFLLCVMSAYTPLAASPDAADKDEKPAGEEKEAASTKQDSASSRAPAPAWMRWGLDFRGRIEWTHGIDFDGDRESTYYLNRIRVWAGIEPTLWLRFYVQGQDARAPGYDEPEGRESVIHHFDLRQAYAEWGRSEGTWAVRAGRQELAFGDERLIGADSYWDALGQSFDAIKVSYRKARMRIDGFGAFVITPTCERLMRGSTGNQLYGIYVSFDKVPGGLAVEPYLLLKRNRNNSEGIADNEDIFTYGVRTAGNLPLRSDYNVETAYQSGRKWGESVRAWAAHGEMGFRPLKRDFGPRLALEYNVASGDKDEGDGRYTTFDDLYPAGYNKYGMSDPFAWRNIRNMSGTVDWSFTRRFRMGAGYRAFWVSSTQDALYTKGESYLVRNLAAADNHVGNQATIMAAFEITKNLDLYAGYARFFPGPFLLDSSVRGRLTTPYLMLNYRFE